MGNRKETYPTTKLFHSHTSLGWFFLIIEIIIASRIGMVIYHGNLKDGIGQHTNLLLLVIVICLGVYVLIEFVI